MEQIATKQATGEMKTALDSYKIVQAIKYNIRGVGPDAGKSAGETDDDAWPELAGGRWYFPSEYASGDHHQLPSVGGYHYRKTLDGFLFS